MPFTDKTTVSRKTLTKPQKVQWRRPVQVTFEVEFAEPSDGGRKLSPADIERASAAAAAAFRTSLEGRSKPYLIKHFEVAWKYLYLQGGSAFRA